MLEIFLLFAQFMLLIVGVIGVTIIAVKMVVWLLAWADT